jgi:hypothetical protein
VVAAACESSGCGASIMARLSEAMGGSVGPSDPAGWLGRRRAYFAVADPTLLEVSVARLAGFRGALGSL